MFAVYRTAPGKGWGVQLGAVPTVFWAAMSDLEFLREQVPGFEGYGEENARHHSDQRVRALLGSALAELQERLKSQLDAGQSARLDKLILRCQFPDQRRVTQLDHMPVDATTEAELAEVDRDLVSLAEKCPGTEPATLPALLDEIESEFARRSAQTVAS
jgi:hypothetical protein